MVDAEKRRRLRRAAAAWLSTRPRLAGLAVSFEILGIHGRAIRDARCENTSEHSESEAVAHTP